VVGEERGPLSDEADVTAFRRHKDAEGGIGEGLAPERDAGPRRPEQAGNGAEDGGLAGA
jgi:hypothetical protein